MQSQVDLARDGMLLAPDLPAPPTAGRDWSIGKYALALTAVAVVALLSLGFGYLAGDMWVGGLIGAVPVMALILVKPEIGLFMFVLYMPFEWFGQFGPYASLNKFVGIFTFIAFLPHMIGRRARLGAPFLLAMAFGAWSVLSLIGAASPELAYTRLFTRFQMIALVFLVVNVCITPGRAKAFFWMLFLASVAAALGAVFLTPEARWAGQLVRATIGGSDVNSHAKSLLPGLFLLPFVLSQTRASWMRAVLVVAFLGVLAGIVQTGSRSNYMAAFIGMVVGLSVCRSFNVPRRLAYAAALIGGVTAFIGLGIVLDLWAAGLWDRIVELWQEGLRSGGRIWLWARAFEAAAEHPVMGIGIGNSVQLFMEHGLANINRAGRLVGNVHNDILTHFAETGLPGVTLYLSFLVASLVYASRVRDHWLRAGLIGLFVAANVAGLANPSTFEKSFWLQMSACVLGGTVFAKGVNGSPAAEPTAIPPPHA